MLIVLVCQLVLVQLTLIGISGAFAKVIILLEQLIGGSGNKLEPIVAKPLHFSRPGDQACLMCNAPLYPKAPAEAFTVQEREKWQEPPSGFRRCLPL